jgi:hypothetical protein
VRSRQWLGLALSAASLQGLGCGRRATAADCQLIVDRSVELQSKAQSDTDPTAIQERERRIRAALEAEIKQCETRRVTDRTMACVQAASTSEEIETCLR